jgi:hypothetical protein
MLWDFRAAQTKTERNSGITEREILRAAFACSI